MLKMLPGASEYETKKYTVCPTCEGVGKTPEKCASMELSLPPIHGQIKNVKAVLKNNTSNKLSGSKDVEDLHLPSVPIRRNYATMLEHDFLGVPETFENPLEALKIALQNIKQGEWQSSTPALINLMQISRFQPELLDSSMPLINRSLCSLLNNTRLQIVRTACQVAREFYKTVQYIQRPEFDELAGILLLKSTHTKKEIKEDARKALDAMIVHLPLAVCVRVLASERGASHKNALIRATVSSLLWNIVNTIGVDCLFSNHSLKDTRQRVFKVCAKFLADGNCETRNNARKIFKLMMEHADFDTFFNQDVDHLTRDNIQKHLVSLKYN